MGKKLHYTIPSASTKQRHLRALRERELLLSEGLVALVQGLRAALQLRVALLELLARLRLAMGR